MAAARSDPEDWHQANAEFHRVVIHRSANRLLARMTEGLWDRSIRHFSGRVLSQAHFRRLRDKEHQRILQAIVKRDADAVEEAWRHHVYQSGLETVDYLRSLAVSTVPFLGARGPRAWPAGGGADGAPVAQRQAATSVLRRRRVRPSPARPSSTQRLGLS